MTETATTSISLKQELEKALYDYTKAVASVAANETAIESLKIFTGSEPTLEGLRRKEVVDADFERTKKKLYDIVAKVK